MLIYVVVVMAPHEDYSEAIETEVKGVYPRLDGPGGAREAVLKLKTVCEGTRWEPLAPENFYHGSALPHEGRLVAAYQAVEDDEELLRAGIPLGTRSPCRERVGVLEFQLVVPANWDKHHGEVEVPT